MFNIGIIQKTYQLNGGLKITTNFDEFDKIINKKLILEKKDSVKLYTLKNYQKLNNKKYIIYLDEVNDLEKSKELVGYMVKIRRDLLPEPTLNKHYNSDLLSFKVYFEDEYIGDVFDILETAAHNILVVYKDDNEIMIPFVKDVFIKNIDFDNKKIDVHLIEGML